MNPSEAGKPLPSQRRLRVLIVEDIAADAELVIASLKRAGYAIAFEVVDSAEQFQQRLSQAEWDLILSDHNLRTWTGMEALDMVQSSGRDTPFIVVTATLGDEAAVEYIKQGAADYVLKHRLERLPAAVGAALRERAHRAETARLQEQILCAKREWELTFDTVPDPVFLLDDACRVQRCNRAATEMLGLPFSQLMGRPCFEVIHGLSEKRPDCPHTRLLQSGMTECGDLEEPRLRKVFLTTCTPLRGPSGNLRGCVQVMHDITERKRTEEALRKSEAQYRGLFENAPHGMYQVCVDGSLIDVNPALVEMLGYNSKEEVLALNMAANVFYDPKAGASLREGAQQEERVKQVDVEWKRKDGTRILVETSGRAACDPQGRVQYLEMIAEDVTQRRTLEKQNRQLQKFEAIGQLAGGIAHDFNNVIGAILGWAEIGLAETTSDHPSHSRFQKICDQAAHAVSLTRQLLAFARRQILETCNLNLNAKIHEVVGLLENIIGEHIQLKMVLAPDPWLIRADPSQVEQVLMNLCLNARDAMPQGGQLIIETKNTAIDEDYCRLYGYARPGDYVLLAVSDTGTGMDKETMERIFEPFFTTKEIGKGTGLGLAMVYGIVKQHGGFVHVYSEPGQGSAFRAYFPATTGPADVRAEKNTEAVRGGRETILVAEDHEGARQVAREILERLGYTVLVAANGEEALRLFESNHGRIALVILDVIMPKLGGPDVYAQMRATQPGLPALLTTGYTTELSRMESLMRDGAEILAKPYNPTALARKVREILDRPGPKFP